MSSSVRHILVTNTGNPRGQGIYIPTEDGCIQKSTLLSQYPNAIGLKYSSSDGRWFSVTSNKDGGFLVPEGIDTVVVTCKAADQARQILGTPRLASDVSMVFGPSTSQSSSTLTFDMKKRKDIRNTFNMKTAKKRGFQKTVKVTFVKDIPLPTLQRKDIVIQEGMLNLNSSDVESTIKDSLSQLLHVHAAHGSESLKENLVFLSCSDKMLSLPTVPHGFSWTGEALKANIGQGKLYVMLKDENKQVMIEI